MLAIAISSVVFVTIFGIMSTAQNNAVGASTKSAQARISKEILADLLLNEWSTLLEYHNTERYFDPEGNWLQLDSDELDEAFWAFRAKIEVNERQAEVPGATPSDKGGNRGQNPTPVMSRQVVVKITNGYLPEYEFETGTSHSTFPTWVTKTDKL